MHSTITTTSLATAAVLTFATFAAAGEPTERELNQEFTASVKPLLKQYCLDCHGSELQEAKLDLSGHATLADVLASHQTWQIVSERLEAHEMPPEDAEQPTDEQRQAIVGWIRSSLDFEARRNAGDPGPVLVRRLSNAEYNNTIRDLTGVDIRPTATFPVDPANEAGFDNSGESLAMSPALLNKYLDAARQVAEHLVLRPEGIAFAPHPVVTNTDRDKYCVKRIVQFYQRQPTDYGDYFYAAWQVKHRRPEDASETASDDLATGSLSGKYLRAILKTLAEQPVEYGPLAKLQSMWSDLPADAAQTDAARRACEQMRDYVVQIRKQLAPSFPDLEIDGSNKGSQPLVLWKNRQYAAYRQRFDPALLDGGSEEAREELPPELAVPQASAEREEYVAALTRFCHVFPDAFYISERGRDYLGKPKDEQEKGRLLSAGFHSMMGYFRDDGPLYELVLDEAEQRELDGLWDELNFVTSAPMRQYSGFLWFERTDSRFMRDPEFDFARAEDLEALEEENIERLAELYLSKARRNGGDDVELQAISDYFENINAEIRRVEQARVTAQPSHVDAVLALAERAYRRPMAAAERQELRDYYHTLRDQHQLSHEDAVQDLLVSVLMSPSFCYRMDLAGAGDGTRPLADWELANRLSYFLWASIPDRELLGVAEKGKLHEPAVLLDQTRRMLRDERVRGLASEFAGNWLDFRHFEQHNSVDRERYPMFTDELRRAMFEEPIRFFMDVAQRDRSVLDFLYADHTLVNPVLARHYGMADVEGAEDDWQRVGGAGRYQRGGLLSMSVFLTANSPGLRTSPVKRGYWIVRRLLGERIPPPPPNVPELPSDEKQLGDRTLAEMLAQHRAHASCAGCHDRFDSIGLAFESFDPVGQWRRQDLAGRPVDTHVRFPGSDRAGEGVAGLQEYLKEHREQEYIDNLCRKLLSYALSRSLMLSDEPLVQQMQSDLAANGYRFSRLVESIVTSPQFLNKRGRDHLVEEIADE